MKFYHPENIKNIPEKPSESLRYPVVISLGIPIGDEAGVYRVKVFKKKHEWVILKAIKNKT